MVTEFDPFQNSPGQGPQGALGDVGTPCLAVPIERFRSTSAISLHIPAGGYFRLSLPGVPEGAHKVGRSTRHRDAVSSSATQPWAPVSAQVPWCDSDDSCREQVEQPQCQLEPDKTRQFGEIGTCRTKRDSTWRVGREIV